MVSELTSRIARFFATLDLKCEMPERQIVEGMTPFLDSVFSGQENFWMAAEKFQALKGHYSSDMELVSKVAGLLREDPRNFLVLTHLHRQLRFTNLELLHFFFDRERLDDLDYYSKLMENDPVFKAQFARVLSSRKWANYVGTLDAQNSDRNILLASLRKTLTNYFGSEKNCWKLWKSRIENDDSVSRRIAEYLVNNEDLKQVIETGSLINALKRSLRTVNVELLKRERGEFGARKVHEILGSNGFSFDPYPAIRDVEELESFISTQRTLSKTNDFVYTTEKLWKKEDKRFDFVLIAKNKIQYVIEVNYFTTSMSKIREVVRHFIELKRACRGRFRLIYITDGMGWFGLAKDIKRMIEFEFEEQDKERSRIPFLMNLEIFRQEIDAIKAEML
ncbi:MAG: DpnII family type II restriction endonuclease [Candidatus Bathyarchaeia archaeon]